MVQIDINDIPEEGLTLDYYASREPWLKAVVARAVGDRARPGDEAHVVLTLVRAGEQVSMTGGGYFHFHPTCDRCLKVFDLDQQLPIHLLFTPRERLASAAAERAAAAREEVELTVEDLDVGSYEGRKLDVETVIAEQIALAQPMQWICSTECRGLCSTCGADLNAGPCRCPQSAGGFPFRALKEGPFPAKKGKK